MPLLSDNDRQYVLEQLRAAPDSVLADAMLAFNEIRDKVVMVRKMSERPAAPLEEANPAPAVTRSNVPPGVATISKIGSNTKEELFKMLGQGVQPPAKYREHLKLLWERGEVKFDGEEWYV